MKRFFGTISLNDIKKEKIFKDDFGYEIIVQAGETGWVIIYPDNSTESKYNIDTVENNYNDAVNLIIQYFNIN